MKDNCYFLVKIIYLQMSQEKIKQKSNYEDFPSPKWLYLLLDLRTCLQARQWTSRLPLKNPSPALSGSIRWNWDRKGTDLDKFRSSFLFHGREIVSRIVNLVQKLLRQKLSCNLDPYSDPQKGDSLVLRLSNPEKSYKNSRTEINLFCLSDIRGKPFVAFADVLGVLFRVNFAIEFSDSILLMEINLVADWSVIWVVVVEDAFVAAVELFAVMIDHIFWLEIEIL